MCTTSQYQFLDLQSSKEAGPTIKNYHATTSSVAPGVPAWILHFMKLQSPSPASRNLRLDRVQESPFPLVGSGNSGT